MIDDALAELRQSKVELSDLMLTLLNAAQTNEECYIDSFSHDDADRKVQESLIKEKLHIFCPINNLLAIVKNLMTSDANAALDLFTGVRLSPSMKRRLGEDKVEWLSWLPVGDRRLLQVRSVTPNVIVVADKSGNYCTVP